LANILGIEYDIVSVYKSCNDGYMKMTRVLNRSRAVGFKMMSCHVGAFTEERMKHYLDRASEGQNTHLYFH